MTKRMFNITTQTIKLTIDKIASHTAHHYTVTVQARWFDSYCFRTLLFSYFLEIRVSEWLFDWKVSHHRRVTVRWMAWPSLTNTRLNESFKIHDWWESAAAWYHECISNTHGSSCISELVRKTYDCSLGVYIGKGSNHGRTAFVAEFVAITSSR